MPSQGSRSKASKASQKNCYNILCSIKEILMLTLEFFLKKVNIYAIIVMKTCKTKNDSWLCANSNRLLSFSVYSKTVYIEVTQLLD